MSPFEIFRRNLKPLMVFLTLLALFAFVVLPAMQGYLTRQGGAAGDPVVAEIDGTAITASRLEYFTRNHYSTVQFLRSLAEVTIQRGGMPSVPNFSYNAETKQIQSVGIPPNASQMTTLATMQFAAQAREAGFELDDSSVKSWLDEYTDGKLTDGEVLRVLMDASQNKMGEFQLYEQLRSHLLASMFQVSSVAGLQGGMFPLTTPAEQWEDFLQINQTAIGDAYGVLVSEYIDQTNASPSNAEIDAVYQEGIQRYSSSQSPIPGFRKRDSITVEYLVGDLNKLIDEEKVKFSEEKLREEYEKRVQGGAFDLPPLPKTDEADPADADSPEEPATGPEKAATGAGDDATETGTEEAKEDAADGDTEKDMKPADADKPKQPEQDQAKADTEGESSEEFSKRIDQYQDEIKAVEDEFSNDTEPSTEESGDESAKPEPTTPTEERTAEESPAPETPEEEPVDNDTEAGSESTEDENPANEGDEGSEENDQARVENENGIRLVAMQNESADTQGESKESESEQAPVVTQDEEKKTTEESEKEPNSDGSGTDTPASDDGASEAVAEGDASAADGPPSGEETEEAEPRVKPFEEVRDEIAESLAMFPAKKRLERAVSEAKGVMKSYFTKHSIHSGNPKSEAPVRPNLKALAEKLGMIHVEIGPHDIESISPEPIAKSFEEGSVQFQRGLPFVTLMFGQGQNYSKKPLYAPLVTVNDTDRQTFVSWKVEEVEAHAPPLDDEGGMKGVRDEVIAAIRMAEARKLATEAAEKIAARINSGDKFEDVVDESKKANLKLGLAPFKWMEPQGFQSVSIGNVPELDSVGNKFMEAVFTAEPGKCVVAANMPESVIYVVRPTEFQPPIEDLQAIFKEPIQRMMAMPLATESVQKIQYGFRRTLDEKTGFSMAPQEGQ